MTEVLKKEVIEIATKFLNQIKEKEILVVSHLDTDGITSAAIMIKSLKKMDKKFFVRIVKNLEKEFIKTLPKDKIIVFLDLASGSLDSLKESGLNLEDIFILDHHEINSEIPEKINILNPHVSCKQKISGSGLTYLFCKELNSSNKEFAKLAILGMIGDRLEKDIDKLNNGIVEDSEVQRKKGLLIYPATRPINRVLEYSSSPFIPGVTGDAIGVTELLRNCSISNSNGKYPSIIELQEEEMTKLITAIMLRNPKARNEDIVGDIFLIKMFNKLEDARELSARINACSRLGRSDLALQLCMELPNTIKQSEAVHVKYKQQIISGLKFVSKTDKIEGKGFVIINAQREIKDTLAGTITSILSSSAIYEEGTIITTMARNEDDKKIKISSRIAGGIGRNVREVLSRVIATIGGEVGGHECAAGCLIPFEKEEEFIDSLKKQFEVEFVKI